MRVHLPTGPPWMSRGGRRIARRSGSRVAFLVRRQRDPPTLVGGFGTTLARQVDADVLEAAGEGEPADDVVADGAAAVDADVELFVHAEDRAGGLLDPLAAHLDAVDGQSGGAAEADTASVVIESRHTSRASAVNSTSGRTNVSPPPLKL